MKTQRAFRVVAVLSTVVLFQAVASSVATADETPSFSRRQPNCLWGRLVGDPLIIDFRDNRRN